MLHTKPAVQDLCPDFVPLVNELQTITFGLHCDSREVSNLIQETKTGLVKKLSNFLQIKEKILLKMHFSEVQIVTALCNEDPGSAWSLVYRISTETKRCGEGKPSVGEI